MPRGAQERQVDKGIVSWGFLESMFQPGGFKDVHKDVLVEA